MKTLVQITQEIADLIGELHMFDFRNRPELNKRLISTLDRLRPFGPDVQVVDPIRLEDAPDLAELLIEVSKVVAHPFNKPWPEIDNLKSITVTNWKAPSAPVSGLPLNLQMECYARIDKDIQAHAFQVVPRF